MKTYYASPERAEPAVLESDIEFAKTHSMVQELIEIIPAAIAILNTHRQIIFCNPALLNTIGAERPGDILGLRLGEALQCQHAQSAQGGCGTSKSCRYCGAVNAIIDSQKAEESVVDKECYLSSLLENRSFEFKVRAKTLLIEERFFTLIIVDDISNEKRRDALERTFFHDIINTAGGIQGLMGLMATASEDEMAEYVDLAILSSQVLLEELNVQKELLAAEKGTLELLLSPANTVAVLGAVMGVYKNHNLARGKSLTFANEMADVDFMTDSRLLTRVIGNMVKNALEAEDKGQTITMGVTQDNNGIQFWVHNPQSLSEKAKYQIFKRSFSTKGQGRGLGTYSMKLLGETCLGGKVDFTSSGANGTTFFIVLPENGQSGKDNVHF